MAPMTAGVASPMTPPAAITLASTSSTQNCDSLALRSPVVMKSPSSTSSSGLRNAAPASMTLAVKPMLPPGPFTCLDSRPACPRSSGAPWQREYRESRRGADTCVAPPRSRDDRACGLR